MPNQGFNLNDYQRNLYLAQQAVAQNPYLSTQFTPRSARKNMYSVIEVQSDDEIRNFKIEGGITYIFLNENSDKIYIRQLNEQGEMVTFPYVFSQNQEDILADPVSKLERRMENIERMLGGLVDVQSKGSNGDDEGAAWQYSGEDAQNEDCGLAETKPRPVQKGNGGRIWKD